MEDVTAIFIVRNPFKSIFSMYNFNHGDNENSHIATVPLSKWNLFTFIQTAFSEAYDLRKTKRFIAKFTAKENNFKSITVKFEYFFDSQHAFNQMDKILRFLYKDSYYNMNHLELHKRIRCVIDYFLLTDYGRFGGMHRKYNDSYNETIVTSDFAYNEFYKHNPTQFCEFWNKIKWVCIQYNYTNLPSARCQD